MKHSHQHIRDVNLTSERNPYYQLYLSKFKKEKPSDKVLNHVIKAKSETMSYVLEMVIREWVKQSKHYIEDTIIEFQDEKKKLFRELDYVLKNGRSYTIGELKVSSNDVFKTASKQLIKSNNILKQISNSIDLQFIHVDLNYQNTLEQFDKFQSTFSNSKFRELTYDRTIIQVLHLSAKDVFNWGLEQGIIKTPELLSAATAENELIVDRRKIKHQIKDIKTQLKEDAQGKVASLERINDLEFELAVNDAKIDLSQKGWAHIKNTNAYFSILENIKCHTIDSLPASDYHTYNSHYEFITYCNSKKDQVMHLNLMDGYKVYQRLSTSEKDAIENLYLELPDITGENRIPVVNNKGKRRIFFEASLCSDIQNNNGLTRFNKIINSSEPIDIHLKEEEYLIIDNCRILHKRVDIIC